MTRAQWEERREAKSAVLVKIAGALKAESPTCPVVSAMGGVAWGRFEGESSVSGNKDSAVFGCGYLDGVRDTLLRMTRDPNRRRGLESAERMLADYHKLSAERIKRVQP
ncbi:MAG: hypothetical protein AAB426_09425 [Myxococcota bacterium]